MSCTGYTSGVIDGKIATLKDFAMLCARAMGACIMMRDEPSSTAIPDEFRPSTWSKDAQAMAQEELDALLALSPAEVVAKATSFYVDERTRREKANEECRLARARCLEMALKVDAWQPPTPDHQGLKTYMFDQLRITAEGNSDLYDEPLEEKTPTAWLAARLFEIRARIASYEKSQFEENERTASRNQWLRDLRASLAEKPA